MEDENPHDHALLSAARAGDRGAYAQLYGLHRSAAVRYAGSFVRGVDIDDVVNEAFAKIMSRLEEGAGPEENFRAYLLTTVRSIAVDHHRRLGRETRVGDFSDGDLVPPVSDGADRHAEAATIREAYLSLSERWREVLWRTTVVEEPIDVAAKAMGTNRNALSVMAHRAREGLRQAYLAQHIDGMSDESCRPFLRDLPAYVRGALGPQRVAQVEQHLRSCARCPQVVRGLIDLNSNLGAVLPAAGLAVVAGGHPHVGAATHAWAGKVAVAVASLTAGAAAVAVLAWGSDDGGDPPSASPPTTTSPAAARVVAAPTVVPSSAPPPPPSTAPSEPSTSTVPPSAVPTELPTAPPPVVSEPTPSWVEPVEMEPARLSVARAGGVTTFEVATRVSGPVGTRVTMTVVATNAADLALVTGADDWSCTAGSSATASLECTARLGGAPLSLAIEARAGDPAQEAQVRFTLTSETGYRQQTVRVAPAAA